MYFVYLDTGFAVDASSEEEAVEKAIEILKEALQDNHSGLKFLVEEE